MSRNSTDASCRRGRHDAQAVGDGPTYWLELSLAAGIATLGLVLNSAGVIIGAMLIAPLMTPIVELAMGLVVTSSTLVINALGRALASVLFVIAAAALITTALPFHEPTNELLARTAPTVLDLVVAMFCAVAGAAVTARPSPAGASTAAGTAIGISLVPPLCACGFGLGTGDARIAEGALLLFVANFCAILTFAGLFFGLVGFGATTIVAGDGGAEVESGGHVARWKQALIRRLDRRLAQPHGAALRLLIPVLLLVAVMVPLTRALRDVTYEVRARAAMRRLVQSEPLLTEALQMTTDVQRRTVRVSAVVVGSVAEGQGLEHRLRAALVASGAPGPLVRVRAVPSAGVLTQPGPSVPDVVPPIELVSPGQAADRIAAAAIGSLRGRWPAAVGTVAAAHVEVAEDGSITVAATLVGPPVDATARAVLAAAVGDDLGRPVVVRVQTLPAALIDAPVADAEDWWTRAEPPLASRVRHARRVRLPHDAVGADGGAAGGRAPRATVRDRRPGRARSGACPCRGRRDLEHPVRRRELRTAGAAAGSIDAALNRRDRRGYGTGAPTSSTRNGSRGVR